MIYVIASLIPPARIVPSLAFGPCGGLLGASWGSLRACWEPLGASEGLLGASWAPFGAEGSKCPFGFPVWALS
eukprot:4785786-Pyramimonas_sp.AAC.1